MARAPKRVCVGRIQEREALQVSFSKRRQGLFKKAAELSTLCGTESAILVESPGEKVYSLGEPDVYIVIDRFLRGAAAGEASPEDFCRREMNQQIFDCLQSCTVWLESAKPKVDELNREFIETLRMQTLGWGAAAADLETPEVDLMLCAIVKGITRVELTRREKDPPLHPTPRQPATWENPARQPYTGALRETRGPYLSQPIPPLHHFSRQPAAAAAGGVTFAGFTPSGVFSLAGGGSSCGYPVQWGMGVDPVRRLRGLEDFSQGDFSAAGGRNLSGFSSQDSGALPPLPISWLAHSSLPAQQARGYNYYNPVLPGEFSSSSSLMRNIGSEGDERFSPYSAPLHPLPPLPPAWMPLHPPPEDDGDQLPPL